MSFQPNSKTSSSSAVISTVRSALIKTALILFILFVCFVSLELIARFRGHSPYREYFFTTKTESGQNFFEEDPVLGFVPAAGKQQVHFGRLTFQMTHDASHHRITGSSEPGQTPKKTVWILGDSVTEGWGVNDNETYAWLLQRDLGEDYAVTNFAAAAYGTAHSYLQLEEALSKQKAPDVIILAYGSYHDERNTLARKFRKVLREVGVSFRYPFVRKKGDHFQWRMEAPVYRPFPFMNRSAFVHWLERTYNQIELNWFHSSEISEILILRIADLAERHDSEFLVAGMNVNARPMLQKLEEKGLDVIDIAVPPRYRPLPEDTHPNAAEHRLYAEKLKTHPFFSETN